MAACVGVDTARVDTLAFSLGAGIAGLAGCALSQIGNVGPDLGQSYIVDSFLVVVLGGVGQLAGTVVAGLGLGVLNKFLEGVAGAVLAKIMVLGSSNETGTCWRAFLWQKLRAAGIMSFDFVGRTNTGPDCGVAGYDKDLEAAPVTIITGFSANDFAVRFKANPPDMVLVHVGGADVQ